MAYFLFKLVRMYTPPKQDTYKPARRSLTFFAVITLILIIITIINACVCMSNFNKGLKRHVNRGKSGSDVKRQEDVNLNITGKMPTSRMEID